MQNKKCGMKECNFVPNLKSLIQRFLSKTFFFKWFNASFNTISLKIFSNRTYFISSVVLSVITHIFTALVLVKGRFALLYSAISEVN